MIVAIAPAAVDGARLWLARGYQSTPTARGWTVSRAESAATRDPVRIDVVLTGEAAPGAPERVGDRRLERSVENLGPAGSGGDELQLTWSEAPGAFGVSYRQVRQQDGLGEPAFELDALIRGNGLYVTPTD